MHQIDNNNNNQRYVYYSAQFKTMEEFLKINSPCSSCIVCITCVSFGIKLRKEYAVMMVRKPCDLFDSFITQSQYQKVIYKFEIDYHGTPYGYVEGFWGHKL